MSSRDQQHSLTSRDRAVLRDLWLFRYLTTAQIARLHFGNLKLAQRRMRVLVERGFVDRFRASEASQAGFGAWWYRLARSGAAIVAESESLDLLKVMPPNRRPRAVGPLAHQAELTDFRIWLREGCQASEGRFGYRFVPSYEEVRESGRRRRRVALSVEGHSKLLVPDGVFVLERDDDRRALFLLEVDRGTEPLTGRHRSSIEGKFTMYRGTFDTRGEKHYSELFDTELNGFRILCVVPDQKRRAGFLRLAARMDLVPLVWVATSSVIDEPGDLDRACWHTTLDGEPHALAE